MIKNILENLSRFTKPKRILAESQPNSIYDNYNIGIVIPIYQKKYIIKLISQILNTVSRNDYCICIVNDGKVEVARYLDKHSWPANVEILNLSENGGFARANNAGWKYLSEKYPSIKYLGTLNDDTIPRRGWLDAMVNALSIYPQTAMSAPIQETRQGLLGMRKDYAVYQLGNVDRPWIRVKSKIDADTFVPAVGGFCFLARREALEEVGYFDEAFLNSGEDLDLCLKLVSKGWRIVVCKDAHVFHYAGQSRYMNGAKKNPDTLALLAERWGDDLKHFNVRLSDRE